MGLLKAFVNRRLAGADEPGAGQSGNFVPRGKPPRSAPNLRMIRGEAKPTRRSMSSATPPPHDEGVTAVSSPDHKSVAGRAAAASFLAKAIERDHFGAAAFRR